MSQTQEVSNEANKRDLHEFRRCCLVRNGLFNHVFLWRLSRHLICFITWIVICISRYVMHITRTQCKCQRQAPWMLKTAICFQLISDRHPCTYSLYEPQAGER